MLIACILVLRLAITTSLSSVHKRMSSFSCSVLPAVVKSELPTPCAWPLTVSGKCWRSYTGNWRLASNFFVVGFQEPSAWCTPPLSATGPLNTQSGSGDLHKALPASISSCTILATSSQPASCHNSKGPCCMPKPQRMARSKSRAVSATSCRWIAA